MRTIISTTYQSEELTTPVTLIEESVKAGDFDICLIKYFDLDVGIIICFDDLSIFFAFNAEMSYNECEYLTSVISECDIAFVETSSYLLSTEFATLNLTRYYSNDADYSLSYFGNMKITKRNSSLNVRCID